MSNETTPTATAAGEKPSVVIIGGLGMYLVSAIAPNVPVVLEHFYTTHLLTHNAGYVGRFLALYIHNKNLSSDLRLVDKQLPELAHLSPEFTEACSRARFLQADASREAHMQRIFDRPNGKPFDYVFNCGGETRYSQEDEVYRVRSHAVSMCIGTEAAKRGVKCYIEVSTGMVYKPDSAPRKESAKLKPWSRLAKWKLQAEEDLAKIEGLNLCILRLAHVYGPYTSKFLGTALCLARVYQSDEQDMKWLWNEDLRTNTVHVDDVVRAMWAAADWYARTPQSGREKVPVFNIVDQGNTCKCAGGATKLSRSLPCATAQGTIAGIIHTIFKIPTVFQGTLVSQFAKLHLDTVVDDLNDDTLDTWADLQAEADTDQNCPLSPFMEKELLRDTDLSMDGGSFIRTVGFQ
jgi:nucleoside-diphosphate-sugar epimerase